MLSDLKGGEELRNAEICRESKMITKKHKIRMPVAFLTAFVLLQVALAAPTGKAAARLQEAIQKQLITLQCAYSEFVFENALWPDFTPEKYDKAIEKYQQRNRRFGGR